MVLLKYLICMLACMVLLCQAADTIIKSEDVSFYRSVISSEYSDGTGDSENHDYDSAIDEPTTTEAGKRKSAKHGYHKKHRKVKHKKSHILGKKKSGNKVGLGTKIHNFASAYLSQLIPMTYERYKNRIEAAQDDNYIPTGIVNQAGIGTSSPYINIVNDMLANGVSGLWNHPIAENAKNSIKSWILKKNALGTEKPNTGINNIKHSEVELNKNSIKIVKPIEHDEKKESGRLKAIKSNAKKMKTSKNVDRTKPKKMSNKLKLKAARSKNRKKHIKVKPKTKEKLSRLLETRNEVKHTLKLKKRINKLHKLKTYNYKHGVGNAIHSDKTMFAPIAKLLHKHNIGESENEKHTSVVWRRQ